MNQEKFRKSLISLAMSSGPEILFKYFLTIQIAEISREGVLDLLLNINLISEGQNFL